MFFVVSCNGISCKGISCNEANFQKNWFGAIFLQLIPLQLIPNGKNQTRRDKTTSAFQGCQIYLYRPHLIFEVFP